MRWSLNSSATGSWRVFTCCQGIQRRLPAGRAHNPVFRSILTAQILHHRFQNAYVVIHRQ